MTLISPDGLLLCIEHDAKRPECKPELVRVGLVDRDAQSRCDMPKRALGHFPVACSGRLPHDLDGGVRAGKFIGRNVRRAQWGYLACEICGFNQEATELDEEPFHDVGRDRHCPFRHSGEADIAQQRKLLSKYLRVGEDMGT